MRRIYCLLLALMMVLAVIPAMSLAASADDTAAVSDPGIGTYDYYAGKGMWYNDGHLIAAVDMTHITEENVLLNNGGLNSANVGDNVRFIYSNTNTAPGGYAAVENTDKHTYIRIVDGQADYKGKFFLLSIPRDETTPKAAAAVGANTYAKAIYPDEFGNITYNIAIAQNSSNMDNGVINLGHAFSEDELSTKFRIYLHNSFIWKGTTYDSSNHGSYNSLLGAWWSILGDDYNNPYGDTLPNYAIETVTKISTTNSGEEQYVSLSAGNHQRQLAARFKNGKLTYFYTHREQTNLSPTYEMLDDTNDSYYSAISTQVLTSIEYTDITTELPTVNLDYTFMLPGKIYTMSVDESTNFDARYLQPKSTDASQVLFVRIYDRNLTAEQMQKNHLADLMYYYNIDLGELTAEDFEPFYDVAVNYSVGLHQSLDTDGDGVADIESDENADYVTTVNALKAMVAEATALKKIDVAAVLASAGFQAKTNNGVGVRALFTVDKTALETLEATYDVAFKGYIAYNGDKLDGYEVAITNYIGDDELENYGVDGTTHKAFAVTTNYVSDDGTQSSIADLDGKAFTYAVDIILTNKTSGTVKSYTVIARSKAGTLAAESLTAVSLKQIMDYYSDGTKYALAEEFKLTSAYKAYDKAVNPIT